VGLVGGEWARPGSLLCASGGGAASDACATGLEQSASSLIQRNNFILNRESPNMFLKSRLAKKTTIAFGFGLVGLSGMFVNQALFWLFHDVTSFRIAWAAILATQGSTIWNFVLIDKIVYRRHDPSSRWYQRFAKSWATNTASLLLRVPLLLALAHVVGMNPYWANFTTLLMLFGLRFWISDRYIWGSRKRIADLTGKPIEPHSKADVLIQMKSYESGPHLALNLRTPRQDRQHYYDIHGLVSIRSEVQLPELDYFRVGPFSREADITVRRGYVGARRMISKVQCTMSPGLFVYREHLGSAGANFRVDLDKRITVTVSPLLASSKHVVYTNIVEALLRFVLVNKGYMLLHSATVRLGEETIMLSAQTDTGKTGTILRLLQEHPDKSAFLSDDMTIINREGEALSFPKPLTISSHTLRAVNTKVLSPPRRLVLALQSRIHSKEGRQFALLLARLNIPIIAINAMTQILIPPPKYMIDRLVPTARYSDHGVVRRIFNIGRGPEAEVPLSHEETMATLLANTEDAYGFPPFAIMERAITLRTRNLRKGKKQDISTLRSMERGILGDFLRNVSACQLMAPNFGWADVIPERVLQPTAEDRMPAMALTGLSGGGTAVNGKDDHEPLNGNGDHAANGNRAHAARNGRNGDHGNYAARRHERAD
jgi:dolichol-phosphate mannosyltransferase